MVCVLKLSRRVVLVQPNYKNSLWADLSLFIGAQQDTWQKSWPLMNHSSSLRIAAHCSYLQDMPCRWSYLTKRPQDNQVSRRCRQKRSENGTSKDIGLQEKEIGIQEGKGRGQKSQEVGTRWAINTKHGKQERC